MKKTLAILRSSIYIVFWWVTVLVYSIALWLTSIFAGYNGRYKIARAWCRLAVQGMSVICGAKYRFINMEVCDQGHPVIILSKHQSAWETLAYTGFIPHKCSFVYKRELHMVPLFGWSLALLGMFCIDRNKGREAFEEMVRKAPKYFKNGWDLILFPEGTRAKPGQNLKFKSGGARLAVDTQTPVVPVALNSGECWPKGGVIIYPGTISVVFGNEINPKGLTAPELNHQVQQWVEHEMKVISPNAR
ncbi:MAG: 1-acyl-sn-glycerol-3-phosphate acyltransferase [Burkholderiales bacterium]|nr:1-acyl-sn-glycerol-3-phosphate acyltransferase [Burkholderiales bacterium]